MEFLLLLTKNALFEKLLRMPSPAFLPLLKLYKISPESTDNDNAFLSWVVSLNVVSCYIIESEFSKLIGAVGWKEFIGLNTKDRTVANELINNNPLLIPHYCLSLHTFFSQNNETKHLLTSKKYKPLFSDIELSTYYNFTNPELPSYFYRLAAEKKQFVLDTKLSDLQKIIACIPTNFASIQYFSNSQQRKCDHYGRKSATALLLSKPEAVRRDFIKYILDFRAAQPTANFFEPIRKTDYEEMALVLKNLERQNIVVPILEALMERYINSDKRGDPTGVKERFAALINITKQKTPLYLKRPKSVFLIEDIVKVENNFSSPLGFCLSSAMKNMRTALFKFENDEIPINVDTILKCIPLQKRPNYAIVPFHH